MIPPTLPLKGLFHNGGKTMFVILNEVKNLIESSSYKTEILRLTPQNDITTQSLRGEGEGGGNVNLFNAFVLVNVLIQNQ